MAPISPGKISGPPRKSKKPTATTKAHRFEGFARRISKIKIDPVHTVQKTRISEDHNDLTTSFFQSALDEWSELNLSATFTSFFNKAQPLSESLPQLLYHADKVSSLLHEHIDKRDPLALEPLLSLVAHFAHDLGASFEKYFSSTVTLVAKVSASIEEPDSIEQCFTCLAWMFKYLSRRLVLDLRPLLETMLPYLSSKKEYVRRFSAESLAFLLRKSAMMFAKKADPLRLAVLYLFEQIADKRAVDLEAYENALMTLLSESAAGVDAQLHSSAVDLFICVFDTVLKTTNTSRSPLVVLDGTIIHLIHRTDAKGFAPLLQLIVEKANEPHHGDACRLEMILRLLTDVTITRKGSRIQNWQPVIESTISLSSTKYATSDQESRQESLRFRISAAILQYSPMNQLLPHVGNVINNISSTVSPSKFFSFCEIVATLGNQRFQDLLLPPLQQYIITHWSDDEDSLCYLLRRLRKNLFIVPNTKSSINLACPRGWEQSILKSLSDLPEPVGFPLEYAKYMRLYKDIDFPAHPQTKRETCYFLKTHVDKLLQQQHANFDFPIRLNAGWAFEFYLHLLDEGSSLEVEKLSSAVLGCRSDYYQLEPFLNACLLIIRRRQGPSWASSDLDTLLRAMCNNMLSESIKLRELSIEVLLVVGSATNNTWVEQTCGLILELLKTPYQPSNARQIAMLIRHLPKQQELCNQSSVLQKLVPFFGLGMLLHYHDQTRKDLCNALGLMATKAKAEDIILDVVIQWLQSSETQSPLSHTDTQRDSPQKLSPFQCSNFEMLSKLEEDAFTRYQESKQKLQQDFERAHTLHSSRIPRESRTLALQVLLEIPEVAERRSRALSPVFLSVQHGMTNNHVPYSDESASSHTLSLDYEDQPWSLKDRKLFLELMGKFVNPRVLYRSREIYDHLMELLTNGSTEVRKLALLAILNWKEPSLPLYRETLLQVAEEKNGTSELALLLANEDEDKSVKRQDRSIVLPILLRLVFGQLIGRTGTHGSQEAKRKSILRLLFRMREDEVDMFQRIALGRLSEVSLSSHDKDSTDILTRDVISQDQQYGFLRMMLSFQEVLQNQYGPFGSRVVDAVLYCTARACRQCNHDLVENASSASVPVLTKNIRRNGVQCLITMFSLCENIDWNQYIHIIFDEIVTPRIPNLAVETSQGVSGLLQMFSAWSNHSHNVRFLRYNDQLLENLWLLLASTSTKDAVKVFIIEQIVSALVDAANVQNYSQMATEILKSGIDMILQAFVNILQQQPSKELLLSATKMIPSLAPFALSSNSANEVLNLLTTLLCQPGQRMPPHVKGQILSATNSLLETHINEVSQGNRDQLYEVTSKLFNYFKDHHNRLTLGSLLSNLTEGDADSQAVVQICQDLNAVSTTHLDEIDHERQLAAYTKINSLPLAATTPQQWLPILNNLLYFARTADDFAIRSNAVNCLKRYLVEACQSKNISDSIHIRGVLLPAFKKGVKENSELVRADYVAMYGMIVKHLPDAGDLEDLKVLLVGDDEEASFFSNILHIQQHRRIRAIRRLLTEVERGAIKGTNIAEFFLPLLEKFMDDNDDVDESAQGVKGQSIAATSVLLQWVEWKIFRTVFRQYRSDLDSSARPEKDAIKLLSNGADALTLATSMATSTGLGVGRTPLLRTTLPAPETVASELKSNFIPKLSKFIHFKDEVEISLRIPAAKVAIKLIKLLPANEIPLSATPIILDISQILRSRAQESRDIARNTLAEIIALLGPSSLQFALKEMRTTLTRGYQLHVLSYTVHTILLKIVESLEPGDLDYCLEELASVIMDDIFGSAGQEKENQDYISGMKEVKRSKSQDSLELLAKSASVKALSKLVKPLQTLLTGNLGSKQVRQVDDLFRRLGVGISHNPAADSRDLLIFAFELIEAFYKQKSGTAGKVLTTAEMNRQRFLIQMKSASETSSSISSPLQYKIAKFALDIVRSTLAKHTSLLTAENVHGFLPVVGDVLLEGREDVKISALRLLATVIRLPLDALDQNAALYVMEAVKIVKNSISTNEESAQAALKLVAALLRERKDVEVRHSDIAYLLQRTMPDIEEPDRQGVIFNFIKSVMGRMYELPEVYELMDKVAVMMITNQTRSARDMARGVFVHFLLEYPQSKNRWSKQLKFLVKNLEYEFREGRQSVMEAVHVLVRKVHNEILQELISTFFVPIVLRMASDDDQGCRDMAEALLAQLFRSANQSQLTALLEPVRSWLEQTENPSLSKVSIQAWSVYFDVVPAGAEAEIPFVRKSLSRALQNSEEWEIQYQATELFFKLCKTYPATVMTRNQAGVWTTICQLLLSPHVWIQISAVRLVAIFLHPFKDPDSMPQLPLKSPHGLAFDETAVRGLLYNMMQIVKRNEGNLDLAQSVVDNLVFLGKLADTTGMTYKIKTSSASGDNEESMNGADDPDQDLDYTTSTEAEKTEFIPAVQYLLDQLTFTVRREPNRHTTASFTPRLSAIGVLTKLIPQLSKTSLTDTSLTSLLVPLVHITDPSLQAPRSSDTTFAETYQSYIESAHALQSAIQSRVGDAEYVKLMTETSKIVRERRGERRMKRAIDRVAEPERAEREKKRKKDMKARRKKSVVDIHRKRRRGDLGF